MKYLKLTLLLLISNYSYSQYGNYTTNNIALSILEPGIALEYSIAPKTTVRLRTAITAVTGLYEETTFGMQSTFISYTFHPISSFAIRNYYNIEKRDYNRRRTDYNSANYFSLSAIYMFKNINETEKGIILTDSYGFSFYCPLAFKTRAIKDQFMKDHKSLLEEYASVAKFNKKK